MSNKPSSSNSMFSKENIQEALQSGPRRSARLLGNEPSTSTSGVEAGNVGDSYSAQGNVSHRVRHCDLYFEHKPSFSFLR